jgi:hypothetical protein
MSQQLNFKLSTEMDDPKKLKNSLESCNVSFNQQGNDFVISGKRFSGEVKYKFDGKKYQIQGTGDSDERHQLESVGKSDWDTLFKRVEVQYNMLVNHEVLLSKGFFVSTEQTYDKETKTFSRVYERNI